MEFDESMSCGKVYLAMAEYHAWRAIRDMGRLPQRLEMSLEGKEKEVLQARA